MTLKDVPSFNRKCQTFLLASLSLLLYSFMAAADVVPGSTTRDTTGRQPIQFSTQVNGLMVTSGAQTFTATKDSAYAYSVIVPAATGSIKVRALPVITGQTFKFNGKLSSTTYSDDISLSHAHTSVNIVIIATDGRTMHACTLNIIRRDLSSNATLASLTTDPDHRITTTTGPAGYENRALSLPESVNTFSLTAIPHDTHATVEIDGEPVKYSKQISVVGKRSLVVNVWVIAEDGNTIRKYRLAVTHTLSDNTSMSITNSQSYELHVISGSANENREFRIPRNSTSLGVSFQTERPNAKISVNGAKAVVGATSRSLTFPSASYGLVATVNVVVTAEDGVTTRSYAINVRKPDRSDNSKLSSIRGAASGYATQNAHDTTAATFDRVIYVSPTVTTVNLTAVPQDKYAKMLFNGTSWTGSSKAITPKSTPVVSTISVTSEDGTTNTVYKVGVVRRTPQNDNATLERITVGANGSNANIRDTVGTADEARVAYVSPATTSVTVGLSTQNSHAKITVNGQTTTGSASVSVALNTDITTLPLTVMAANGSTTKTYQLFIVKRPNSNALLSKLVISPDEHLVDTTGVYDYNKIVHVSAATTSVKFLAVSQDPHATMKLGSSTLQNNTYSASKTLTGYVTSFVITVKAEDGVSTKTYGITVIKQVKALITSIASPGYTFTPLSSQDKTHFKLVSVNGEVTSLPITVVCGIGIDSFTVAGVKYATGESFDAPLQVGSNYISISVTGPPPASYTRTYKLVISRDHPRESGARLATIVIKDQQRFRQSYQFDDGPADTVTRLATAPFKSTSANFYLFTYSGAHVSLNGTALTATSAGEFQATEPLEVGANYFEVEVTSKNGAETNLYKFKVVRTFATEPGAAKLIKIATEPSFDKIKVDGPGDVSQAMIVSASTNSIVFTPTAEDPDAHITVNGEVVASGASSSPIATTDPYTLVTIVVTAIDGRKVYTVNVIRKPSKDASLGDLVLGPPSDIVEYENGNYITMQPYSHAISVKPTATNAFATIKVAGQEVASGVSVDVPLSGSVTDVPIAITAENGAEEVRVIHVKRQLSHNANLSSIDSDPHAHLTSVDGSADETREMNVSAAVSSIKFSASPYNQNATVKINGASVANGAMSGPISLTTATTVVFIVVTAQDGVTTKTYAVKVKKASGATLMALDNNDKSMRVNSEDATTNLTDAVVVHQAVSPNGDGINDRLIIDNIISYPDNELKIIEKGGKTVYSVERYDNVDRAFDGRTSSGSMLTPGTYFYNLSYKAKSGVIHKTGYIVLKY